MIFWWTKTHRQHEGQGASCGAGPAGAGPSASCDGAWEYRAAGADCGDPSGGAFGVRRPLRFLAYKLKLGESQVSELARILNELKTERAQADVDDRRALASLADAVAEENFDVSRATQAATVRVAGTQRLQEAVVKALSRIHALLSAEQRSNLAYLIRTGTLTLEWLVRPTPLRSLR
jgi:Spy/CpxP family protein refolding chaperone